MRLKDLPFEDDHAIWDAEIAPDLIQEGLVIRRYGPNGHTDIHGLTVVDNDA